MTVSIFSQKLIFLMSIVILGSEIGVRATTHNTTLQIYVDQPDKQATIELVFEDGDSIECRKPTLLFNGTTNENCFILDEQGFA